MSLRGALIFFIVSLYICNKTTRRLKITAKRVPKWAAIGYISPVFGQLNIFFIKIKCAELEIGRNSVVPCIIELILGYVLYPPIFIISYILPNIA